MKVHSRLLGILMLLLESLILQPTSFVFVFFFCLHVHTFQKHISHKLLLPQVSVLEAQLKATVGEVK